MSIEYFIEREPKDKRCDPVTGRPLKNKAGCLPYNRLKSNPEEMDEYFNSPEEE